ncbi:MAG TPA: radical SAM protein [Polyangia bacterium]|jgi:DNA repair photolyase
MQVPAAVYDGGVVNAAYHEVLAKSITRRAGTTDPWFLGRYGMNLYRGCEHGCLYCDGRAERYHVAGDFARDIQVKRNAPALLAQELAGRREPGFVLLGGGVSDSYQPAEARFGLARGVLEVCLAQGLPVHVLTKSALVERDLDLLAAINARARAILSFSIATVDEALRARFEPGAAPIATRFALIARAKARGLAAGVMGMPLLPGLADQPAQVAALVQQAREAGADFVCLGGLTLRPGVQAETYRAALAEAHPDLVPGYDRLYRAAARSGAPEPRYLDRLEARGAAARRAADLPGRVPWPIFRGLLPLVGGAGGGPTMSRTPEAGCCASCSSC